MVRQIAVSRAITRRLATAAGLVLLAAAAAQAQVLPDALHPGANSEIRTIAVQPDGKILVGGSFTMIGGGGTGNTPRNYIARLNPDGTVDMAFNPGATASVNAIALQPDGKILVGGYFSGLGDGTGATARSRIGRLNSDGTVDSGFNPGANDFVDAILVQPDGRILVAGAFGAIGGGGSGSTSRMGVARLTSSGDVEAFNVSVNTFSVNALALQPDGKILLGGSFTMMGGLPRLNLARVNSDGSIDGSFDPGVAGGLVFALAVQPDGDILIGGSFTGLGGGTGATPRNNFGRLNADGTVDAFNPGANGAVGTIAVQADGQVLVAGFFTMLGGGSTGTSSRQFIGRLNADGSLDTSFDPGASGFVRSLALQPDGRILVAGAFGTLGGGGSGTTPRFLMGRLMNTHAATGSLVTSADLATITWQRGGTAPEVSHVEFASSTDGVTYTPHGAGTRVPGGWQVTGLSLAADPNLRVRARGFAQTGYFNGSGSIAQASAPIPNTELIQNGDFSGGSANWLTFALPDDTYIVWSATAGQMQFHRRAPPAGQSGQAVVFQQTGLPLPAMAPIEATFQIGNTDTVRKRISVLIHDANFSDLHVCTFWLPANTALQTYTIRTHTTQAWTDVTISFYAASANPAGNTTGFFLLDNVSLVYAPAGTATATTCVDPLAPTPPGGSPGGAMLTNGDFNGGTLPPWTTFGQIQWQISGGVFEFLKLAGTPSGVVFQPTGQPQGAGQILTVTFQLGNSSGVRKRVTVILHDLNFSDLSACTFWLAPRQPLLTYTYRAYATQAWGNATFSVYPATVGADQWIQLDNVNLQQTPGAPLTGAHCVEPGGTVPTVAPEPMAQAGRSAPTSAPSRRAIELTEPTDLTRASEARVRLSAWLVARLGRGEIQVTTDGGLTWETVAVLPLSDDQGPLEIDLSPYLGRTISLRFVFDPRAEGRYWH